MQVFILEFFAISIVDNLWSRITTLFFHKTINRVFPHTFLLCFSFPQELLKSCFLYVTPINKDFLACYFVDNVVDKNYAHVFYTNLWIKKITVVIFSKFKHVFCGKLFNRMINYRLSF